MRKSDRMACNQRSTVVAFALVCALVFWAGCSEEPRDALHVELQADAPQLVLLWAPCTVNRLFLSPYNSSVDYTPNFARFASEAVTFTKHQAEAGQSAISYASILTGAHADEHGIFSQPTVLDDSVYTVVEAFAENGYDTFFWAGHSFTGSEYNFNQGVPQEHVFEQGLMADDLVFKKILTRIRDDPTYKVFIFTNFMETHAPYRASRVDVFCAKYPKRCVSSTGTSLERRLSKSYEWYRKFTISLSLNYPETVERLGLGDVEFKEFTEMLEMVYASNIHQLDSRLGLLMTAIEQAGAMDRSLIAVTADHGETLHRSNALFKWTHGFQLSPEVLNVPLLIRSRRFDRAPSRYDGVTASVDLFPTLLGLAGIDSPQPRAGSRVGVDLTDSASRVSADRTAHSHTSVLSKRFAYLLKGQTLWKKYHRGVETGDTWTSLRVGDMVYKYRNLDGENWGFQAFDLSKDPTEEHNVFDEQNSLHKQYADSLLAYRDLIINSWRGASDKQILNERATEGLRELGYIE